MRVPNEVKFENVQDEVGDNHAYGIRAISSTIYTRPHGKR